MKVAGDTDMDMKSALLIEDAWRNEWNRGVQVPVDDCPRAKRARLDFRKVDSNTFLIFFLRIILIP